MLLRFLKVNEPRLRVAFVLLPFGMEAGGGCGRRLACLETLGSRVRSDTSPDMCKAWVAQAQRKPAGGIPFFRCSPGALALMEPGLRPHLLD